jgi:2-amino-4-hydroxy-6-hydroxymethyldihydropteridine diphosphokinase
MNSATLLIGGNLGNREENLATARMQISVQCGQIVKSSSIYQTAPWGNTDQNAFLNQALEIETSLNARQLIRKILKIEKSMGRIRKQKMGPRIIDIDILLFGQEEHDTPFLKVPHPEMQNRRFALEPLAEISPNSIHPVFKKTISELLESCSDQLPVSKQPNI